MCALKNKTNKYLSNLLLPHSLNPEPGSEEGQAVVRFKMALGYLGILALLSVGGLSPLINPAWGPALAYALFAYCWLWLISGQVISTNKRKALALLIDHLIFASGFYWGEAGFAFIFWAPIFATIGYGLRFGTRYVYASGIVGAILIPLAMYHSSFWHQHVALAFGIVIASCILPAYAFILAERIARSKKEMEIRAKHFEMASKTDILTGLLNRTGFSEAVDSLLSKKTKGAVLYIDLDGFKAVNDSFGHTIGDQILKEVGVHLRNCLRYSDQVARLGGDEFGICIHDLLEDTDAHRLAEKIISSISSIRIAGFGDKPVLGASVGVCALPHGEANCINSVMRIADELMYQAKRSGKNCYTSTIQTA